MYNEYSAVVVIQMMIIAVLVIKQKGEARKIVSFLFASAILAHNYIFIALHEGDSSLDWYVNDNPFTYYFSSAMVFLFVILVIGRLKDQTQLSGDIQYISLAAIGLNLIGWLMSVVGLQNEIIINSVLFIALYGFAITFLIIGEPKHEGRTGTDSRFFAFHSGDMARRSISNNH